MKNQRRKKEIFRLNYWRWGINRDGENTLGKLWMKLRKIQKQVILVKNRMTYRSNKFSN